VRKRHRQCRRQHEQEKQHRPHPGPLGGGGDPSNYT
jgi:hypothetical protein